MKDYETAILIESKTCEAYETFDDSFFTHIKEPQLIRNQVFWFVVVSCMIYTLNQIFLFLFFLIFKVFF